MRTIRADQLLVGDVIDAEPYLQKYAPESRDVNASEYELLTVEHVERETEDCVVVGMGSDHYGVPPSFEFRGHYGHCVRFGYMTDEGCACELGDDPEASETDA